MINYYLNQLQLFEDERGFVKHGMKYGDVNSSGIREVYFSNVKNGYYKGWKKHQKMILNIIVISGEMIFYLANSDFSEFVDLKISHKDQKRLTIMPNQWVAFTSVIEPSSTLINISNLINNEDIVENKPFFLP
tara:strand:+ start:291 stop:689 length:399 start_codon:yes stop_codon:yes gene_type:complete